MGSKFLKTIAYIALFGFSFVLFLYWLFPYASLKDRISGLIERELGQGLEVSIDNLKPYWFTGVEVGGMYVGASGSERAAALVDFKKVRARASLFSLIFGRPHVSFYIEIGKGEIEGSFTQTDEVLSIDAGLDDVDIGNLKIIAARTGLNVSSKIDGQVSLRIDKQKFLRSTGRIQISPMDLQIAVSELKIGEMTMPLPDLVFSKGRESEIELKIEKGTINIDSFKLAGGDLTAALAGKIFLSTTFENYRLNLSGSFETSKKLADALPFLFIIEQQKQPNGSYPLSITGRLAKPSVKVGSFTIPL